MEAQPEETQLGVPGQAPLTQSCPFHVTVAGVKKGADLLPRTDEGRT